MKFTEIQSAKKFIVNLDAMHETLTKLIKVIENFYNPTEHFTEMEHDLKGKSNREIIEILIDRLIEQISNNKLTLERIIKSKNEYDKKYTDTVNTKTNLTKMDLLKLKHSYFHSIKTNDRAILDDKYYKLNNLIKEYKNCMENYNSYANLKLIEIEL